MHLGEGLKTFWSLVEQLQHAADEHQPIHQVEEVIFRELLGRPSLFADATIRLPERVVASVGGLSTSQSWLSRLTSWWGVASASVRFGRVRSQSPNPYRGVASSAVRCRSRCAGLPAGHVQHTVGFIEGERCPEGTAGEDRILGTSSTSKAPAQSPAPRRTSTPGGRPWHGHGSRVSSGGVHFCTAPSRQRMSPPMTTCRRAATFNRT